jgi:hypothetical protein
VSAPSPAPPQGDAAPARTAAEAVTGSGIGDLVRLLTERAVDALGAAAAAVLGDDPAGMPIVVASSGDRVHDLLRPELDGGDGPVLRQ